MFTKFSTKTGKGFNGLATQETEKLNRLQIVSSTLGKLVIYDVNGQYRLATEGFDFSLTFEGFDYLCYRASMPVSYFKNVGPDLTIPHFQLWFGGKLANKSVRVFAVNGAVMSVVTDVFAYIENQQVIDQIGQIPNLSVADWSHSPKSMTVNLTADNRNSSNAHKLQNGDEIVLQMRISNSDLGWGKLDVRGVVFSKNGQAILPAKFGGFSKRHQGDVNKLWVEFSEVWDDLTVNFARIASQLDAMASKQVDDLDDLVARIVKSLKLPVKKITPLLVGATHLDIWSKLLEIAQMPEFASHREKIEEAAGSWILAPGSNNPLWVKF